MHCIEAHELLGHPGGEDRTKAAAKAFGWVLVRGKMHTCQVCAVRMVKYKNAPRYSDLTSKRKATGPCERIFLNMSSIKNPKNKDPDDKTPFILRPQM